MTLYQLHWSLITLYDRLWLALGISMNSSKCCTGTATWHECIFSECAGNSAWPAVTLCFTKITIPFLLVFLFLLFFSALSSLLLQVAVLLLVSVDAACWDAVLTSFFLLYSSTRSVSLLYFLCIFYIHSPLSLLKLSPLSVRRLIVKPPSLFSPTISPNLF